MASQNLDLGSGGSGTATALSGDVTGATSLSTGTGTMPAAGALRIPNNVEAVHIRTTSGGYVAALGVDTANYLYLGSNLTYDGGRPVATVVDASTAVLLAVNGSTRLKVDSSSVDMVAVEAPSAVGGAIAVPANAVKMMIVKFNTTSYAIPCFTPGA